MHFDEAEMFAVLDQESPSDVGTIPSIDPRSFHVFDFQGDRLLFDRATGTVSHLNDFAFSVLKGISEGQTVADAVSVACPSAEAELYAVLSDLIARGFFRYAPSKTVTEDDLQYLWDHHPRRIQLLMAEGCNLGCRYCYQWRNGTNQKHTLMPWSIARTAIDYLVWRSGSRNDVQVTFFGGEPLLNYPMIQRVVDYCRSMEKFSSKRFTFELITNGTLLTKEVTDYLVQHRFLLFISLDGWREMHEHNRPSIDGGESYDTIVKNAVYANEQYTKHKLPMIKIRANLTNRYHDTRKVSEFFHSLGFKHTGIGAIEPLPHGNPSPAALSEDQMDELTEETKALTISALEKAANRETLSPYEAKCMNANRKPLERVDTPGITCGVCRNTTVVDNRGNMYPCHRYGEMQEYIIGNVATGLDRKLVMKYYQKLSGHSTEECQDCWIRDYCGGGCAWLLSDKDGKLHHPTKRECSRRRQAVELQLWARTQFRELFPDTFEGDEAASVHNWSWDSFMDNVGAEGPARLEPTHEISSYLPIIQGTGPGAPPPAGGCGSCSGDNESGCGCNSGNGLVQLVPLAKQV